jgi:hypothetical protein
MNATATIPDAPARHRPSAPPDVVPGPISEATARLLAVLGIAGIAVVHILDAAGTYADTRYIFWLYMAIIVGAVPISLALLHWRSPLVWFGPLALALGPFVGYVLSRSVGLPSDSGDIGNWLETLGIASLFIEASVFSLSVTRLVLHRRGASGWALR